MDDEKEIQRWRCFYIRFRSRAKKREGGHGDRGGRIGPLATEWRTRQRHHHERNAIHLLLRARSDLGVSIT